MTPDKLSGSLRGRRSRRALPLQLAIAVALASSCGGEQSTTSTSHGAGQDGGGDAGATDAGTAGALTAGQGANANSAGSGGMSLPAAGEGGEGGDSTIAGSAGTSTAGSAGAASTTPPNVIFVLVDDFSMNLLKYMPNVLKMQGAGATFSNYFVTDSLCCPSRTSMFTGKYPHNSGVFTNTGDDGGYATYLSQGNDPQTFAVALTSAGYRAAMMGKFLNGYDPTANQASKGWTGWDVAGDGYPEFNYDLNQDGTVVHYGNTPADYLTDVMSGLAQKFASVASPKPFLMELASFAPHAPYIPAPRHAALFPNLTYPKTPAFGTRPTATDPDWLQAVPPLTAANLTNFNKIFRMRVQAIQAVDEMIGALSATLKKTGHDKDTYLFFTSDNGYHIGERSMRPGKQTAFDTDIHVPLVVTGPGVPAGLVLDQMVQNIDLCPTFADIANTPAPATVNGHSLLQLLHGKTVADWRNAVLVEHHDAKYDPNDPDADTDVVKTPPTYNALRTLNTVYVEYVGGETEYHDRTTDPDELRNTAAALTPAQVTELDTAITAIKTCKTAAECWAAQHVAP